MSYKNVLFTTFKPEECLHKGTMVYKDPAYHLNNKWYSVVTPMYYPYINKEFNSKDEEEFSLSFLPEDKAEMGLTSATIAQMIDMYDKKIPFELVNPEDALFDIAYHLGKYLEGLQKIISDITLDQQTIKPYKEYYSKAIKFYNEVMSQIKTLVNIKPKLKSKLAKITNIFDLAQRFNIETNTTKNSFFEEV